MGLFRKPLRVKLNLRNKEPTTPRTPRTTPTKLLQLEPSKVLANFPRSAPFFSTRSRAKSIVGVKPKAKRKIAKTPLAKSTSVNSLEIDNWRGSLSSPFNWYGSLKKRRAASINQSGSVPNSLAEKENAPPSPLQHRIKRVPVKRITDSMIFNQATLHDPIPTVSSETASILNASASLSCFGLPLASSGANALTGSPLKQPSYREIRISFPKFPTSETSTSTLRLSRMDFGGSLLDEGFFGHDFNLADYIFDVPEEDEPVDEGSGCDDDKDSIDIPSNDFSNLIKDETMFLSSSLCLSIGSDSSLVALAGSAASLWDTLSPSPSSGQNDVISNPGPEERATAPDPPLTPNLARAKWHSVMVRIEEFQEELSCYLPVSVSPLKNGKLALDSPANSSDSFACVAEELSMLWPMPPTTPIIFVGRPGIDW